MVHEDSSIIIQLPASYGKKNQEYAPPSNSYIVGKWYVTHSSRSWWKGKRNASITYEEFSDEDGIIKIREQVEFQPIDSTTVSTVQGIDTPTRPGAWRWRARSKLLIGGQRHWEIIGFGNLENHQWLMTYFSKTHYASAGVDILSRQKEGLPKATIAEIRKSLDALEAKEIQSQAASMFKLDQ